MHITYDFEMRGVHFLAEIYLVIKINYTLKLSNLKNINGQMLGA